MRSVALFLAVSLVSTGCFPENPRYRTYAKVGELAALVTGVVLLAVSTSGADCDMDAQITGLNDQGCKSHASTLGGVGLALILAGLGGFVATVSTTPDDKTPTIEIKAPPTATPAPASMATPATPPAPTPTPTLVAPTPATGTN